MKCKLFVLKHPTVILYNFFLLSPKNKNVLMCFKDYTKSIYIQPKRISDKILTK